MIDIVLPTLSTRENTTLKSVRRLPFKYDLTVVRDMYNLSRAYNSGAKRGSAPIICFLDDDIEFKPEQLSFLLSRVREGLCITDNGIRIMLRSDYVKVGGFEERYFRVYMEDVEFFERLHKHGIELEMHNSVKHFGGKPAIWKMLLMNFNAPMVDYKHHPKRILRSLLRRVRKNPLPLFAFALGMAYYPFKLKFGGRGNSSRTIHVIGDSHVKTFAGCKGFKVHLVGSSTAYNLIKENSTTRAGETITKLLDTFKETDKALFIFGEIDCRIHIYYKYMVKKQVKPLEHYIIATIDRYGGFLTSLKKENKDLDFAVLTIPPAGTQSNSYHYRYYAPRQVRAYIHRSFNDKLLLFCRNHGIKCVDMYGAVVTRKGYVKSGYMMDEVHLNHKVVPFVVEELKKVGMW